MFLYSLPCWMMGKWHGQLQSFAIWKVTLHIWSLWWPVDVSKKFAQRIHLWFRKTPVPKCRWVKWCSFCCGFRCIQICWHPRICWRHGTRSSLLSVRQSLLEFSWASDHWSLMQKIPHGSHKRFGVLVDFWIEKDALLKWRFTVSLIWWKIVEELISPVNCMPHMCKHCRGSQVCLQRSGLVPQGQGLKIMAGRIVQKGELSHQWTRGWLRSTMTGSWNLNLPWFPRHRDAPFFSAFFGSAEETNSRSDGRKWRCNLWWQVLQVSGKLFDGLKSIMSITYIELDRKFFYNITITKLFFLLRKRRSPEKDACSFQEEWHVPWFENMRIPGVVGFLGNMTLKPANFMEFKGCMGWRSK